MIQQRVQLWSCGGGRQSAGMGALIKLGELPRPDAVVMINLEWEVGTVWPYVNKYIRPMLAELGVPFHEIPRQKYALVDMWGGVEGEFLLLPAFTNQSGNASKLPEFCSGHWKRDVVSRWAAEQPGWKKRGVDNWVGISADESGRRRAPRKKWIRPRYPLLDDKRMSVDGCLQAVVKVGWPPRLGPAAGTAPTRETVNGWS